MSHPRISQFVMLKRVWLYTVNTNCWRKIQHISIRRHLVHSHETTYSFPMNLPHGSRCTDISSIASCVEGMLYIWCGYSTSSCLFLLHCLTTSHFNPVMLMNMMHNGFGLIPIYTLGELTFCWFNRKLIWRFIQWTTKNWVNVVVSNAALLAVYSASGSHSTQLSCWWSATPAGTVLYLHLFVPSGGRSVCVRLMISCSQLLNGCICDPNSLS